MTLRIRPVICKASFVTCLYVNSIKDTSNRTIYRHVTGDLLFMAGVKFAPVKAKVVISSMIGIKCFYPSKVIREKVNRFIYWDPPLLSPLSTSLVLHSSPLHTNSTPMQAPPPSLSTVGRQLFRTLPSSTASSTPNLRAPSPPPSPSVGRRIRPPVAAFDRRALDSSSTRSGDTDPVVGRCLLQGFNHVCRHHLRPLGVGSTIHKVGGRRSGHRALSPSTPMLRPPPPPSLTIRRQIHPLWGRTTGETIFHGLGKNHNNPSCSKNHD